MDGITGEHVETIESNVDSDPYGPFKCTKCGKIYKQLTQG
jgi:hypothetical protein